VTTSVRGCFNPYPDVLASILSEDRSQRRSGLQAGLQTLINKTAISLVNDQGDLGARLKDVGSAAILRTLPLPW
jgi:hypothetical protein